MGVSEVKQFAIFASGTGTNFLVIDEAVRVKEIDAKLSFFFSDKIHSKSFENAKKLGIPSLALSLKDFEDKTSFEEEIIAHLKKHQIDFIVLAGYMKIIGPSLLDAYGGRIINIHPSLLPAYRGKDAIIRQHNDQVSPVGITIHYVEAGVDTGNIIFQKEIEINYPISLEDMEEKIHKVEHCYYKQVIQEFVRGK